MARKLLAPKTEGTCIYFTSLTLTDLPLSCLYSQLKPSIQSHLQYVVQFLDNKVFFGYNLHFDSAKVIKLGRSKKDPNPTHKGNFRRPRRRELNGLKKVLRGGGGTVNFLRGGVWIQGTNYLAKTASQKFWRINSV